MCNSYTQTVETTNIDLLMMNDYTNQELRNTIHWSILPPKQVQYICKDS